MTTVILLLLKMAQRPTKIWQEAYSPLTGNADGNASNNGYLQALIYTHKTTHIRVHRHTIHIDIYTYYTHLITYYFTKYTKSLKLTTTVFALSIVEHDNLLSQQYFLSSISQTRHLNLDVEHS